MSARLAELHAIRGLLRSAADIVRDGWVQDAWFSVATPTGVRLLTAYDVRQAGVYPVTGACLVGSVVVAGGEPPTGQLVQRTLDLTWYALHDETARPPVLCPAPPVRALRLRDLTHWNDRPGRTQTEVVDLLDRTRDLAATHAAAYRVEQTALTPA